MRKNAKNKLTAIYLYFSGYCNLNCRHCWINPTYVDNNITLNNTKEDIDIYYICKALTEAKTLGLKSVKITGGEPFLRKEIIEMLEWLKKNKINISIETNGTLIGEKEAKALRNNKVSFIAVSLDGPDAKTHEELRGGKESFLSTLEGIKRIKKYNPELKLQIICSLWKFNRNKMKDMIDLCRELGIDNLKINPILNISRADSMKRKGKLLTIREILNTRDIMNNYLADKKLKNTFKLIYDIPPAFKNIEELKNAADCRCGIESILGILGDGTISICGIGSVVKELSMGNIKDNRLKEVWENNSILRKIRNNMSSKLEGICGKCLMKHYCLGKCRAEAYWSEKSLLSPYTFCKVAYDEGLFPETRLAKIN
jgi:SynChlorMet cassette radical SAM/SPASM protein ScmF